MPNEPGDGRLVSVVILAFNKWPYTQRCLDALLKTTYRPFEAIVVDNGSTDSTRENLPDWVAEGERQGVEINLILNDGNKGASTARNQGIDAAKGDFVAFLDNDIVIRTLTWMERMIGAFDEDPKVGIISPKLIYPFPPQLIQCAGAEVSPTGRVNFIGRGEANDLPQFNRPRFLQCAISASWMVRRQVIDQAGYFDEIFNPVQFEDIDYCYRVRHLGHKVYYLPSVEMYHFENVTTGLSPTLNSTYLIIKNGMAFKRRWRDMFATEGGPPESEMQWKEIDKWELDDIPPPEFTT